MQTQWVLLKYGNRIIDISFDVDNQLWGKKQYAAMLLSRFTTRFEKLMFGMPYLDDVL